jgi:hypothetical protein
MYWECAECTKSRISSRILNQIGNSLGRLSGAQIGSFGQTILNQKNSCKYPFKLIPTTKRLDNMAYFLQTMRNPAFWISILGRTNSTSFWRPFRQAGKSCSNWAKILSVGSFNYLKIIIFYTFIFILTVKKLLTILCILFLKILYSALRKVIFLDCILCSSLISKDFRTVTFFKYL